VAQIRSRAGQTVSVLAVVKADAYGHGAVEVARTCAAAGASMLGVALVEEGASLRLAGLRLPILVQCCVHPDEIEFALRNDLTVTAPSLEFVQQVSAAAARLGCVAPVHIDIDTGMGRIGFAASRAVEEIVELVRLPNLRIEGVYTHFATSEIEDDPGTLAQLDLFRKIAKELASRGIKPGYVHAANSGAILNCPQAHLNLVRPGLILYGVYPGQNLKQKLDVWPVLALETAVTFLKSACAGATFGYGRTFTASGEMKVATLNVGYADGYPWRLSNKASVLIRGKRAAVVGRVSMDQVLIDVTQVPSVGIGERVVLLGRDGEDRITAENLAEWAGTIPYEILCGISKRVPRMYVGECETS